MPRKFLIIRFSSIGDIVLTSPVVRCLKTQFKDAEIHFLVRKNFSSIAKANPYIDKVHEYNDELSSIIAVLKNESFDEIIDLQNNLRSLKIKMALGVKAHSFNKLNIEKWLYVQFGLNRLPDVHIVDRYLETLSHLSIINDGSGLDYFIPTENEVDISTLSENKFTDYIGMVIGAAHNTKKLPIHKWKELIELVQFPMIILGGKEDIVNGEILAAMAPEKVINACGKFNLHQSASIVKHAKLIVTHDTGLMHIAAAFKRPIVSIWGNTVPEFGMYPYYGKTEISQHYFEISNLSCRPCSKIGHRKCPKGHFNCMEKQNVKDIAEEIRIIFEKESLKSI